MDKNEWESNIYSYLSTNTPRSRIGIFGCITLNGINTFGVNIVNGDDRYFIFLSMNEPKILFNTNNYILSNSDINELMNILINDNGWNNIIDSMDRCIKSDGLEGYFNINMTNIPSIPPDYTKLLE